MEHGDYIGVFFSFSFCRFTSHFLWSGDGVCAMQSKAMLVVEYFDAARHYKNRLYPYFSEDRSQRGILAYKQGDCYRRINYTLKAKGAYMNAVRYRYPDTLSHFIWWKCSVRMVSMQRLYPYYENYLAYAQTLPAGKERKDSLTQIGLTSCRLAQEWKKAYPVYCKMGAYSCFPP